MIDTTVTCPFCEGDEELKQECEVCKGKGKVDDEDLADYDERRSNERRDFLLGA